MMQGCRVVARALSAQGRYRSVDAKHVLKQIEAFEISSQAQLSREPLLRAGGVGGARTFATSSLLTKVKLARNCSFVFLSEWSLWVILLQIPKRLNKRRVS